VAPEVANPCSGKSHIFLVYKRVCKAEVRAAMQAWNGAGSCKSKHANGVLIPRTSHKFRGTEALHKEIAQYPME